MDEYKYTSSFDCDKFHQYNCHLNISYDTHDQVEFLLREIFF